VEPEAERLHRELVAAFPGYVKGRIAAAGLPAVDDAVDEATHRLDVALAELLTQPPAEQAGSPLQLVRQALAIPTRALADQGAAPVPRDEHEEALLPEDGYALAPATSRDMGEAVWQAHVAWGVAKAHRVAGMVPVAGAAEAQPGRPIVAVVSSDLMDRSKLVSVAEAAGYQPSVARNPAAVAELLAGRRPSVAFVDLTHSAADEMVRSLAAAGVRTVAFGPHVDDLALARARSLGAVDAVPRSRFFRDPALYLPRVV
jgi:hypothetical protein